MKTELTRNRWSTRPGAEGNPTIIFSIANKQGKTAGECGSSRRRYAVFLVFSWEIIEKWKKQKNKCVWAEREEMVTHLAPWSDWRPMRPAWGFYPRLLLFTAAVSGCCCCCCCCIRQRKRRKEEECRSQNNWRVCVCVWSQNTKKARTLPVPEAKYNTPTTKLDLSFSLSLSKEEILFVKQRIKQPTRGTRSVFYSSLAQFREWVRASCRNVFHAMTTIDHRIFNR